MPIYPGETDADYFARTSLSHSDCKTLLESPAKFDYLRNNPHDAQPPTPDMLFGSAVHSLVLGGPEVVPIDANDWRSKTAREERDAALATGHIPLLGAEYDRADNCGLAVLTHPVAETLRRNADHLELVCEWDDDGTVRRAKLDGVTGRVVWDLKTTFDASTAAFGRSAAKYGYHSQAAYYMDAVRACLDIADPQFLFVVVEKHPPHLVNVIKLTDYAVELGAKRVARALDLYRTCTESGEWPGYGDGINETELPRWAEYEEEVA